jgi:hypothetical protein
MAHSTHSIISSKLSGMIGEELVFRQWAGKTIVAKAPCKRPGRPTRAQAVIRDRFLMASRYARAILSNADPALADAYRAVLKPRQNLYTRALQDFISVPVVQQLDTREYTGQQGSLVKVRAVDDFRVTEVWVEIYTAAGSLLESGLAEQQLSGLDWTYRAQKDNSLLSDSRVKATARDVPGNEGSLEVVL